MELNKLLPLLEQAINQKMLQFTTLGKESKKLLQEAEKKERQMASLFMELEPVHPIIRQQHPTMCDLFDSLIELDKENNRKGSDGNK